MWHIWKVQYNQSRIFLYYTSHEHLHEFYIICVFLYMNHPTKLTVVWGRPDFAVAFLNMNHHRTGLKWGTD